MTEKLFHQGIFAESSHFEVRTAYGASAEEKPMGSDQILLVSR
jgi:hypothetical protein